MNNEIKALIKRAFEKTNLTVKIGDGWINIANQNGTHCEFYPCYERKNLPEEILTARYTVDGLECDLDYQLPNEINAFVEVCKKLLKDQWTCQKCLTVHNENEDACTNCGASDPFSDSEINAI